jgi:hypothetical protein
MAGLVPAIHVFLAETLKTWMPGTRPGMTNLKVQFEVQALTPAPIGQDTPVPPSPQ